MSIPQNLVQKIADGNARYMTYVFGYSTSGILPVRNDTYIIIIGFKWWNFLNVFTPDLTDVTLVWIDSVKQIRFYSEKSNNHFIIRQPIRAYDAEPPEDIFYDTYGSEDYKDLYLVHEQNVQIEITNSPVEDSVASASGIAPAATAKTRTPSGYGTLATGAAAISAFTNFAMGTGLPGGNMEVLPLTNEFEAAQFVPEFANGQVNYPVRQPNFLTEQGFGRMSRMVPLVEIQFIEIDIEPTEKLKSSG